MQKMQFSSTEFPVVHNTIKFDALIALTSLGFDKKKRMQYHICKTV